MTTPTTPAHLYGPPPPSIAFWNNGLYLGELRCHPSNAAYAYERVLASLKMLRSGIGAISPSYMGGAVAVLYCGTFAKNLTTYLREMANTGESADFLDEVAA